MHSWNMQSRSVTLLELVFMLRCCNVSVMMDSRGEGSEVAWYRRSAWVEP